MAGLQASTIVSAFVFGMVLSLLGSIKLTLAERLNLGEARVGGLWSALSLALIPMMLLSGWLIDLVGIKWVLISSALLTSLGLTLLSLARTYKGCLGSILLSGLGAAGLSVGSIVLMPEAFWPDSSANPAAALNLGNVFFGLGALVTPTLADVLLRTVQFRRTLAVLALVCLAPAFIAAGTTSFPDLRQAAGGLAREFGQWHVWVAGLVFLLYAPIEGSLGTWTTTYLTDLGYRPTRASWLLSAFWLAFLATRLLTALLQHGPTLPTWSNPWVIIVLALLSAMALGHLAGAANRGHVGLGLLLLGACLGPIFPTLVGIVFAATPKAQHGTAYGLMFAIGSLGSLILPPLLGTYARRRTVRHALRIPMLLALAMAAGGLLLAL
jgi:fucose permease